MTTLEAALTDRCAELERRDRRIAELDLVCDSLSDRIVDRDRELARVRRDLDLRRDQDSTILRTLATMLAELGPALAPRAFAPDRSLQAPPPPPEPDPSNERRATSNQPPAPPAPHPSDQRPATSDPTPASNDERRTTNDEPRTVQLDIGPLRDFSQLVGFEDAAGAIAGASEISVTRFARGRATLEMRLSEEPVELLRELEERAPFDFVVRDQREGHITIDVDAR